MFYPTNYFTGLYEIELLGLYTEFCYLDFLLSMLVCFS